ncbi:excinuclease ABC subunit A [candidate division WOR_3 bacterium SM1_77]|jgi:excinuclease ABC subunit A|uniref:UvrABC system protein A n=1 Tax=candidate division WOR_3 bacterium SM1_77 TaxID=1703778 RepID=A0A0S8JW23_UNCW3|nr:MAG: excinuclease ABC subunit A [candidate division WOR_3 bacterium SM1_77]
MRTNQKGIRVKGARVHNLKNIDVFIPRNQFVVITGLSGSGKSSLAFDTLYAEGQRRYVESLSAYARQFLGMMDKPDVDEIIGLSPSIAIQQRSAARNPRSTVGTVTEIYDYLRVLFARIGTPYCYSCGRRIQSQTTDQIVDTILDLPAGTKIEILAPLVKGRKGEYKDFLNNLKRRGYVRVRVDGKIADIESTPTLERYKKHNIEIVIDRLVIKDGLRKRLADSVEMGLKEGNGILIVVVGSKDERIFSQQLACVHCGISYPEIAPRMFSFNSPYGACEHCDGLGFKMEIDPSKLIANEKLSILDGAFEPYGVPGRWRSSLLRALAEKLKFDLATPYYKLPAKVKKTLLHGEDIPIRVEYRRSDGSGHGEFDEHFEGIVPELMRRHRGTQSQMTRQEIEDYMTFTPCPVCHGTRLRPESLAIKIGDKNIAQITRMSIKGALTHFTDVKLSEKDMQVGKEVIKEIKRRLGFLNSVGLDYLTLNRTTETLAGGEEQRVRLATQIGSGLVGVLYILDEPSIGLHYRDNKRLLATLKELRDIGNTVLVVEHDAETILNADHIIDLGPGAGEQGGHVVATGTPAAIENNRKSITGRYLKGTEKIDLPKKRRNNGGRKFVIQGAKANNLKSIDVEIPLGLFVVITGVSGSGKSTLIVDTLYRVLAQHYYHSKYPPGEYDKIIGMENIDKVINIDQSPIGRTPRSNPGTYTSAWTPIRELFSKLPESKVRGYRPGRFSFNVPGGRCEQCEGDGILWIEMHFLPDVHITCDACAGKRFNRETLEIRYRGKNISDILKMSVTEALEFFKNIPQIKRKLQLLNDVGLGYIKIGQSATTLSGGEAQRIKLAKELSKIATGRTLYILDEPTTGLHFEDVKLLLKVLNRLVDKGNTVIVIEHNMEVIKCADWIIDLGPEGGDDGGRVVCAGRPEEIAVVKNSYTGQYLKTHLP